MFSEKDPDCVIVKINIGNGKQVIILTNVKSYWIVEKSLHI